jgi:hypothetical protein
MEIEETVLHSKIDQVKDKTLHTNWLGWYERRKGLNESVRQIYYKQMFDGIVEDFYSVCEAQQKEIEKLKEDIIHVSDVSDKWNDRYLRQREIKLEVVEENTKLKEEIRMLKQYAEIAKNDKKHRKGLLNKALEEIKQLKDEKTK